MALLHRRGVRGYVTLNTLVFPRELADLEATVRELAEAGVDAVIVQDLGLARLIRAIAPDLEIHASTQMSITSEEGVRLARELGCSRVILARELSLDEIAKIRRQAELPRRGLRPRRPLRGLFGPVPDQRGPRRPLGQPRRVCPGLPDALPDRLRRRAAWTWATIQYLLSPQDLAALRPDPAPDRAGRGQPEDRGPARRRPSTWPTSPGTTAGRSTPPGPGEPVAFTPRDVEEMELSFSRGFSHGFLDGNNHKVLVRGDHAKKRGIFLGRVTSVTGRGVRLDLAAPVKPGDGVVFDGDDAAGIPEQGGRVYEVASGRERRARPSGLSAGPAELRFGRRDLDLRRSARPAGLEDRRPRADPPAPQDVRGSRRTARRPRHRRPGRGRRAARGSKAGRRPASRPASSPSSARSRPIAARRRPTCSASSSAGWAARSIGCAT